MIIRALLILCVLAGALVALRGSRSSHDLAVRRITLVCFTFAWVVAVLRPDLLTTLANWVGVGRGTDLLLYALVVAVVFLAIGIYQRFTRLEERVVQLTRELAIATADAPPTAPDATEHRPGSTGRAVA